MTSTGFEPDAGAVFSQLMYEATQLRAGHFVALMYEGVPSIGIVGASLWASGGVEYNGY